MDAAGATDEHRARRRARVWVRPALFVLLVAAAVVLGRVYHVGGHVRDVKAWVDGAGAWGPAVFIAAYVGFTVMMVPGVALAVVAGVVFNPWLGVACVSVASTITAALAFLIGRTFARGALEHWMAGRERFARLDRLTLEHGAMMVAVTRLIPIFPYNVLNYAFSLTSVRFGTYVFWSWLCMLPGTVLLVVGSGAVAQAVTERRVPWALLGVVVAAKALLIVAAVRAHKLLRRRQREAGVSVEANDV